MWFCSLVCGDARNARVLNSIWLLSPHVKFYSKTHPSNKNTCTSHITITIKQNGAWLQMTPQCGYFFVFPSKKLHTHSMISHKINHQSTRMALTEQGLLQSPTLTYVQPSRTKLHTIISYQIRSFWVILRTNKPTKRSLLADIHFPVD